MSNCMSLTSGVCRGCLDNAGGILTAYVADLDAVDWTTLTTAADGAITELELVDGENWYELQVNQYSSNWVENVNISVENGTKFYEEVITLVFGKNDQALRNTVDEMANGKLVLIIVDNNDKMWFIGSKKNGAYVSGGNSASGQALTDLNGWNVTFTCRAKAPANEVKPAAQGALEGALAAAAC